MLRDVEPVDHIQVSFEDYIDDSVDAAKQWAESKADLVRSARSLEAETSLEEKVQSVLSAARALKMRSGYVKRTLAR